MNFPDKFDAGTLTTSVALDGQGKLLAKSFDLAPPTQLKDASVVPDAALLFSGDFKRAGNDLILSRDDQSFTVKDYFRGEKHGTLSSPEGATLSGAIVDLLTGHTQYAQAGGGNLGEAIGKCAKVVGTATVIRNGVSVELNVGDAVYKSDVVQSGSDSQLGITFIDGTAFSLQQSARMVLNEMVYDPQGSQNSALMTLVQGTLTFVAGQAAKNGDMRIDTPVATMGIRGTAGVIEIGANSGPTKFTIVVEPGGHTGAYNLYDKASGALLGSVSQAGQVTFVTPNVSGIPTLFQRQQTLDEQRLEREIVQFVFQLYFPNYTDAQPNSRSGMGSGTSPFDVTITTGATPESLGVPTVTVDLTNINGATNTTPPPMTIYVNTPPTIIVTDSDGVQAGGIPNVEDTQSETPGDKSFLIEDHVTIVDPDIGGVLNDNPVPYVAYTGSVSEVEAPDSVPEGFDLYALVHLDQKTGAVTYDPSNFRFLGAHEEVVYTISFISASGPDFRAQEMTLTIRGLNDAPEFEQDNSALGLAETVAATDSAAEISQIAVLQFRDPDFSDVAAEYTVETLGVATSGFDDVLPNEATLLSWLHFNAITKNVGTDVGAITQTFSAPDQHFDYLGVGESVTLTYTIRVTDGLDALDTQTVTFTITGSNDGPTITDATTLALTSGAVTEDGAQAASGTITFRDVDLTDAHTLSQELAGGEISAELPGFDPATQQLGTLTLVLNENTADHNTVNWTFTIDNALAQQLAEGQVVRQTYTVTIDDGNGGIITQDVTVTVTGTNDAPTIAVAETTASGAVTEDLGVASDNLTASGTITFQDIDLIDTHTIPDGELAPSGVTVTDGLGNSLPLANFDPETDHLGTLYLTLSEDAADTDNRGQVQWTFEVDNSNPLVQALAKGQVVTQTYTVTIDDGHDGGSVTQTITVTVTGTNDGPVAAADINAGYEDAVISGSVATNDSDVDTGAVLTYALAPNQSIDGLTFNPDGSYTFDASHTSYQYLADGETLEIVVNYIVTDEYGVPANAALTITLTGTNDAPTVSAEAATGAVSEDDADPTLTTEGTISFADLDASDIHDVTVAPATGNTLGGTLTATQTGAGVISWTYEVANATTQYLGEGEQVIESFVVTITDEYGAEVTQTITITVTGLSNDGVDAVADVSSATEGGGVVTGSVDTNDTVEDAEAQVTFELVGGSIAGLTLNPDGGYSFDPAHAAYQHLADGETLNVVATYRITDVTNNLTDTATLTITLTGTNDVPTVAVENSAGSAAEDAATPDLSTTGTITFDDIDLIDAHSVSVTPDSGNSLGGTLVADVGTAATGAGSGTVNWTYTIDNELAQYLAEDEQVTETFTITIDDGHDGTVTHTVTVTITGTNDAPVIGPDDSIPKIYEGEISIAGELSATDVDSNATLTWSGSAAGGYGAFAIDEVSGEWTYTLDQQAANALADGQSVYEIFTVTVTDEHGAAATRDVRVTVIGTNDEPMISAADSTGAVAEDATMPALSTTGSVTFDDIDLTDTHSVSVAPNTGTLGGTLIADVGTAATGAGSGTVNWTYEIDNELVQHLAEDEQVTETFTITIDDGEGGTIEQQVTITVTGTNDAPVIAAGNDTGILVEAGQNDPGTPTATGTLAVSDVDDDAMWTFEGGANGTYGAFVIDQITGEWTYTLDQGAADDLAEGEIVSETFTVTVTDDKGATGTRDVTVTITGASDAPELVAVADFDSANEDDLAISGSVATNDVALNPDAELAFELLGIVPIAGLTFNADGSYVFDPSNAAYQHLADGQTLDVVATYRVTDIVNNLTDIATLTITLTGTNDTPTVSAAVSTGAVAEDATTPTLSATGSVTFDDIDLTDTHTVSVAPETGALGTLIADIGTPATEGGNGTVHWTYEIDNDLVQHLAEDEQETETFTITIDDGAGGTVEQQVTVTATGTNDAPVLSGASLDLTEVTAEDTTNPGQTVGSFLSATDVDSGASKGIAVTAAAAIGGQWQFSLNNGESWTSFGNYAVASALLLAASDKVRFVPDGTAAASNTLTFFAWDQSVGAHGAVVDASVNGGSSAFSTASDTVSVDVGVLTASVVVSEPTGYNFQTFWDEFDGAASNPTPSGFTIATNAGGHSVVVEGVGLTYSGSEVHLTGGYVTRIHITGAGDVEILDITGLHIPAAALDAAFAHYDNNNGDASALNALLAPYAYQITGGTGGDVLFGGNFADVLAGGSGNDSFRASTGGDVINGGEGRDNVSYALASGPIIVDLAEGVVTKAGGDDTLRSIEGVRGTAFNDIFDATGYTSATVNGVPVVGASPNTSSIPSSGRLSSSITNSFEGGGGDDHITGDHTQISYRNAAAGVTVDLEVGTAHGTAPGDVAEVGNDTLVNVRGIRGSEFNDVLYGNNDVAGVDSFAAGDGDDFIDGRLGYDQVNYSVPTEQLAVGGISVNMTTGTVVDRDGAGVDLVGHDTLRSIEAVRGTGFADSYNAAGFGGAGALNIGNNGSYNEFEGMGGDDDIVGNGSTTLVYLNSAAGVEVDLLAGLAKSLIDDDAGIGVDSFTGVNGVIGSDYRDVLEGTTGNDVFSGRGGDDTIDGRGGIDRVTYSSTVFDRNTGGITVNLASGEVIGDATIGIDELRSIEMVRATNFGDTYNATGFGASGANFTAGITFNEIEGMGGNDDITGNGNTRIAFYNANASVTVDLLGDGTDGFSRSTGNEDEAGIGEDVIRGQGLVNAVAGSDYGDVFYGRNNPDGTSETFDGRGGNDTIDGRGGYDIAAFNRDGLQTSGVTVVMDADGDTSTVDGDDVTVGFDTLVHVESIRGTNLNDSYDATGFTGASTDFGLAANFNEFEGLDGDDQVVGNGATRVSYLNANDGVTVDLAMGVGRGTIFTTDTANVGIDSLVNVGRIRGSNFSDALRGNALSNTLEGRNGNDKLDGRGGNDTLRGDGGSDIFVYSPGSGADTIADFNRSSGTYSLAEGDVIDLSAFTSIHSMADLVSGGYITNVGGNTVLNFGSGNTLTLTGVSNALFTALPPSSFVFAPLVDHSSIAGIFSNDTAGTLLGFSSSFGWLNGNTIAGISADGITFSAPGSTVQGQFLTYTLQANGDYQADLQPIGAPFGAPAIIKAIESAENSPYPVHDTFYYRFSDGNGGYIVESVTYNLTDVTFHGITNFTAQAVLGTPLHLTGLEVVDGGAAGDPSDILTVQVDAGTGLLSIASGVFDDSIVTGNGTSSLTLVGTSAGIQGQLDALYYTGTTTVLDTISMSGIDGPMATEPWNVGQVRVTAIDVSNVTTGETPPSTTVLGLEIHDGQAPAAVTVTIEAGHGVLSLVQPGDFVDNDETDGSLTLTGSLEDINAALEQGVVYTIPEATEHHVPTDSVHIQYEGSSSAPDTVVFQFQQTGNDGVTLESSGDRDVMFGTEQEDNFVFHENFGSDVIMDYEAGVDTITFDSSLFWSEQAILDNAYDSVAGVQIRSFDGSVLTLPDVEKANLSTSDFHLVA